MAGLLASIERLSPAPTFAWIPGHVGLQGNVEADMLAKDGTAAPEIELHVPQEVKAEYLMIDNHIKSLWQQEYSSSITGAAYRSLEPHVSCQVKYTNCNRSKETKITRLRLGKCRLKKYLHDIKAHPDGLCATCQVPETIEHVLFDCPASDIPTRLKARCARLQIPSTLIAILGSKELQDLIFDLILEHHIIL